MSNGASLKQPVRPAARPASPAPTSYPRVSPTPSPAHQHLLTSPEALEAPVALPAVSASGRCPPVLSVTPPTPLAPPTLVPLPTSPCEPHVPRVVANDSHPPPPPPVAAARGISPPAPAAVGQVTACRQMRAPVVRSRTRKVPRGR